MTSQTHPLRCHRPQLPHSPGAMQGLQSCAGCCESPGCQEASQGIWPLYVAVRRWCACRVLLGSREKSSFDMSTAAGKLSTHRPSLQEFVTLKPGDKEPVCGRQEFSVTEDRPIEKVPILRPASSVPIVSIKLRSSLLLC